MSCKVGIQELNNGFAGGCSDDINFHPPTVVTAVFANKKASFTNCRQPGTGSWMSTEYTVFYRIYFAPRNIIFVEGKKFIASFETHSLFLSSVLKNYQETTGRLEPVVQKPIVGEPVALNP